jgi:hypothetical protein
MAALLLQESVARGLSLGAQVPKGCDALTRPTISAADRDRSSTRQGRNEMKVSHRVFAATFLAAVLTAPAQAQFAALTGLTGIGGKASSGVDPTKVEQDLKSIVETTSVAMGKYSEALGMKEEAAKFDNNAKCVKAGTCGLSDSLKVIETISSSVLAEAEKMKASGQKLDAGASAAATQALIPAAKAFPLWKQVADGVKDMDKASAMKFAGLVQAAPKVPTAAKGTVDVVQGAVAYLSFSGADTSGLQSTVKENMKF